VPLPALGHTRTRSETAGADKSVESKSVIAWTVASILAPSAALCGALPAAPDSSHLVIAGPREPGRRMVVRGHVYRADGRRPAAGVRVGVYHTDARGEYGGKFGPGSARRDARLSGWLVTDADGKYEVRTIRPGGYPQANIPEHIHFIVGGRAVELRFADDPRVPAEERARAQSGETFAEVRPVTRDRAGVEHVVRDFRLAH
jgi:protocatechuate 3,4-dioxygenase beta subunit